MELSLPLDLSAQNISENIASTEWETWGEEASIEFCEIRLSFEGLAIS